VDDPRRAANPLVYARIAGLLYLTIFVAAAFGQFFVRQSMIVPGDAAATAANITAAPLFFRLGFAADLVAFASDVALAAVLYVLLRPVSRPLALVAAFFRLTQSAILGMNTLNHVAAAIVLGGAGYLEAFDQTQREALALLLLQAHGFGYDIGLVFFAIHLLVLGYLIAVSRFLPVVIGVLVVIAGVGYLIDSFTSFLFPAANAVLEPFTLGPAVIGETALMLWLLVRGLDAEGWRRRAATGAVGPGV
jgi:hypothetical protein